jgi:hypothetical protein
MIFAFLVSSATAFRAALIGRPDGQLCSSVFRDERERSTTTVDCATCVVRVMALARGLALLERIGALMAKNAAETIRKVWMCLVFMRTPFSTTCAAKHHRMWHVAKYARVAC